MENLNYDRNILECFLMFINFLTVIQKKTLNIKIFSKLAWSKAGRTQSGFGPHLARGPPVGPACFIALLLHFKFRIYCVQQK